VLDVMGRETHVGFVAPPGTIEGPTSVVARQSKVAVTEHTWDLMYSHEARIRIYEGSEAEWVLLRVVPFECPYSPALVMRFTGDGTALAVTWIVNCRLFFFSVADGSMLSTLYTGLTSVRDVEECDGGWLVACDYTIVFVNGDTGETSVIVGRRAGGHGEVVVSETFFPSALALVPGLGLVVRDCRWGGRVQCFTSPDIAAMGLMSMCRVAWMVATVLGLRFRCRDAGSASASENCTRARKCQRRTPTSKVSSA
jgi:hypothetical protein